MTQYNRHTFTYTRTHSTTRAHATVQQSYRYSQSAQQKRWNRGFQMGGVCILVGVTIVRWNVCWGRILRHWRQLQRRLRQYEIVKNLRYWEIFRPVKERWLFDWMEQFWIEYCKMYWNFVTFSLQGGDIGRFNGSETFSYNLYIGHEQPRDTNICTDRLQSYRYCIDVLRCC